MSPDNSELKSPPQGPIYLQAAVAWLMTKDLGLTTKLRSTRAHMPIAEVIELYEAESRLRLETRLSLENAWKFIQQQVRTMGVALDGIPFFPIRRISLKISRANA
jgi:hypothetical protein